MAASNQDMAWLAGKQEASPSDSKQVKPVEWCMMVAGAETARNSLRGKLARGALQRVHVLARLDHSGLGQDPTAIFSTDRCQSRWIDLANACVNDHGSRKSISAASVEISMVRAVVAAVGMSGRVCKHSSGKTECGAIGI